MNNANVKSKTSDIDELPAILEIENKNKIVTIVMNPNDMQVETTIRDISEESLFSFRTIFPRQEIANFTFIFLFHEKDVLIENQDCHRNVLS